jgi:hypothetical protein
MNFAAQHIPVCAVQPLVGWTRGTPDLYIALQNKA